MNILLDTNAYRDFCDASVPVVEIVQKAAKVFLSIITIAELKAGFFCGTKALDNEKVLNVFLTRSRVGCLYPDDETANHYARLFTQLRRQGTPVPTNDLWIAALCEQHRTTLVTRDTHFDVIQQLLRIKIKD